MRALAAGEARAATRLASIDRLRGLVIVVMALDHLRDFFDADALRFSPTDLEHTYPALFFTRFVTHYCAPTFTLLAGLSAFLAASRFSSRRELAGFLASRGLWLILLEAFVVSPVWSLGSGKIELGTLWAIGCGLIALSGLVFLPARVVFAVGLALVFGHNLLDGVHARDLGAFGPFWRLLHERGPLPFGLAGGVLYPALPWIGVIALGYGLGPLFSLPSTQRLERLSAMGLAAVALFLLLRGINLYGDPRPWTAQASGVLTALSFLNVTKYPPSLDYALVTLGPALVLLAVMERRGGGPLAAALETFGRAPLFFYVLHLYVGLGAALTLSLARGFTPGEMEGFLKSGAPPPEFGVGLLGAYVAWVALLVALYPACAWFARLKRASRNPLLSYL